MPSFVSVYDDPTLSRIGGVDLNGFYRFDDEGVDRAARDAGRSAACSRGSCCRARPRAASTNRTATAAGRRGAPSCRARGTWSSAEGRRARRRAAPPPARGGQAPGEALRPALPRHLGRLHEHTRSGPQAFKVLPILVYRVWVDGRPDELVRGADLVGTPLSALSRIMAAGDDYQTFNGYCGAESGFVPVSATSPSLLVQQIEIERRDKGSDKPPVLPRRRSLRARHADVRASHKDGGASEGALRSPSAASCCRWPFARAEDSRAPRRARVRVDDAAVRAPCTTSSRARRRELHLGDEPRPYYVAYTISDIEQATVSATFGAITAAHAYRGARCCAPTCASASPAFDNTQLRAGRQASNALPDGGRLRGAAPRAVAAHRRGVQERARDAGAQALDRGGPGQGGTGTTPVGDFSKEAPDASSRCRPRRVTPSSERGRCATRSCKLSAIFRDYPAIQGSRVTGTYAVVRRRMAEQRGRPGSTTAAHRAHRRHRRHPGRRRNEAAQLRAVHARSSPAGLPALAEMEKAVRAMADRADRDAQGAGRAERVGRRAVRGTAAAAQLVQAAARRSAGGHAAAQDRLGGQRRAAASRASSRTSWGRRSRRRCCRSPTIRCKRPGPARRRCIGAYRVDDEGVPAQRVSLIEKGVLKTLLMSRTPAQGDRALERPRARAALRGAARPHRQLDRHVDGARG